jgi:hypothetical protein
VGVFFRLSIVNSGLIHMKERIKSIIHGNAG